MSKFGQIYKRPQAERDIVELFSYLVERSGSAGRVFLKEVRSAFDLILRVPGIGRHWQSPVHADFRVTMVSRRFHDYLIFYRVVRDGIEIVRVVHGARDLTALIDFPRE